MSGAAGGGASPGKLTAAAVVARGVQRSRAPPAGGGPSTHPNEANTMLSLADARRVIEAAERKAEQEKQPMNIAVVDGGGNLVAHVRMDGAWMGSVDISIKKAWTSRAFDVATRDLAKLAGPGGDFYGIHASNDGRVMIFAGGIPLERDGEVVGAIGVSGGSGKQDHAVAQAGAKAF